MDWETIAEELKQMRAEMRAAGYKVISRFFEDNLTRWQKQHQQDKVRGLLGSKLEYTWSRLLKMHTCCKSHVWWRHKMDCPNVMRKI